MKTTLTAMGAGVNHANGNGAPPLYHLKWGPDAEEQIIFEMSADFRHRLDQRCGLDPALANVLHVCVSHVHEDTFGGAYAFKAARHEARKNELEHPRDRVNIYGPQQLMQAFSLIEHAHKPEGFIEGNGDRAHFRWHTPELGTGVPIGGALLQMFPVFHIQSAVEARGFRLILPNGLVFVYTGDAAWPEDPQLAKIYADWMETYVRDANVLLCDARTPIGAQNERHFNAQEAAVLADNGRVPVLVLTNTSGIDAPDALINTCYDNAYLGNVMVMNTHDVLRFAH